MIISSILSKEYYHILILKDLTNVFSKSECIPAICYINLFVRNILVQKACILGQQGTIHKIFIALNKLNIFLILIQTD